MIRYLPLYLSALVVELLAIFFYWYGAPAYTDKWIAGSIIFSLLLALTTMAVWTEVWTIRNAGSFWLVIGILTLFLWIASTQWDVGVGWQKLSLSIARAALVVAGPLLVLSAVLYNRMKLQERRHPEALYE